VPIVEIGTFLIHNFVTAKNIAMMLPTIREIKINTRLKLINPLILEKYLLCMGDIEN
jgi:hypothetical protein